MSLCPTFEFRPKKLFADRRHSVSAKQPKQGNGGDAGPVANLQVGRTNLLGTFDEDKLPQPDPGCEEYLCARLHMEGSSGRGVSFGSGTRSREAWAKVVASGNCNGVDEVGASKPSPSGVGVSG